MRFFTPPQPLNRQTAWYIMSEIQEMRNEFRFRKQPARPRVKTNIHTLGMVEALEARRRGLDQ